MNAAAAAALRSCRRGPTSLSGDSSTTRRKVPVARLVGGHPCVAAPRAAAGAVAGASPGGGQRQSRHESHPGRGDARWRPRIGASRRHRRGRCRRPHRRVARRHRTADLPALGGEGAAGPAAGRQRRRRPARPARRGAGDRLRLAQRRAAAYRGRRPDAGAGRARPRGARVRRALAVPRADPAPDGGARASSRAHCTTTARASTPAFSASPAAWPATRTGAATPAATSAPIIR